MVVEDRTKPLDTTSGESGSIGDGTPKPRWAVGALIDRYVVLARLGEGGSGEVFAAFDPVLDRKVAVKVLHREDVSSDALVREGRMLAKLSDPHVVTIHDVGLHDGQAYMAMELLEGESFEAWCAQRRGEGRWSEVVSALRDIGRGLEAAHAAGIVHGDVKPSNVLIDAQQRVKVSDFGIARALEADALEGPDRTTRIVGTPAFMSPEQHDLAVPDARSDQYSFCLLGWVALTGRLPFEMASTTDVEGTTGQLDTSLDRRASARGGQGFPSIESLAIAKRGPLDTNAAGQAPSNVVAILRRGLSVAREQRWPSMGDLVAALAAPDPTSRWKVGLVVGGVAAAAVALKFTGGDAACQDSAERLEGAWDETARARTEASFGALQTPLAEEAWPRVRDGLDDYAKAWSEQHQDACQATSVRKEQSSEALDLRMACLHRAKTALMMAGRVLAEADEGVVEASPKVVAGLPPLERCEDLEALGTQLPEPEDPQTLAALGSAQERLAEVRALMLAGKDTRALELALAVRDDASTIGYAPLSVDAARYVAHLHLDEAQIAEAKAVATAGLDEAVVAGVWVAAAELSVTLTSVADREEEEETALVYARLAGNFADRPGGDGRLRARVLHAQAIAEHVNSHYEVALSKDIEALQLSATVYPAASPRLATLQSNLANRFANMGKFAEGMPYAEAAAETFGKAFGPRHPQTLQARTKIAMLLARSGNPSDARPLLEEILALNLETRPPEHYDVQLTRSTLGNVLRMLGREAEAEEQFQLELAAQEKTTGLETVAAAMTIGNIASAQLAQGKVDAAADGYARALEISKRELPPGHSKLGGMHDNYGNALVELGRYEEAREQIQTGLAIYEAELGPDHLFLANSHFNLAGALASMKVRDDALHHFQRAVEIREGALDDQNPSLALARLGLGDYYLELNRVDDARPHLVKAWAVYQEGEHPALHRGRAAFAMARITNDPVDAREFGQTALEVLEGAGPGAAEFVEDARDWLAQR